jgi:hypothetical protein
VTSPCFIPDRRRSTYFAGEKLKLIDIEGGLIRSQPIKAPPRMVPCLQ